MGSLSNRQSILRPTSTRAAVAQQGLTQHVVPRPVSGRFLAAHLGVGRSHAASVDVLHRQLPTLVSADIALFYQLHAQAQRLQQQLAAHDRQRHLTPKKPATPCPSSPRNSRNASAKRPKPVNAKSNACWPRRTKI